MAHRDTPPRLQAGRAAALQRTPLVAVVACFILGILVSYYGAVIFPAWASLAAAGLGVVGGGLFLRRAALTTVGVLLAFCATGGAVYHYHCEHLPPGHIAEIVSDERALMKVRGYVCSDPTSRRKTPTILFRVGGFTTRWETAFDVRLNAVISTAGAHPAIGKTKVKLYAKNPGIRYGDELILTGQIQIPNAPTNPSQFDYREYLRRHGIRAILYVGGEAGVDRTGRSKSSVLRRLFALRRRLVSMVAAPSNGTGGKMLAAMLLGAREELPPEAEESFRQSGTVHLLAISGLHVGMVAGAVWLLIGMTGATERVRSIVVILCVACYVFISGARPPAVRAAVMIVLIALGGVLNRRQITINSLGLAALIILTVSPGEIFMRGFQLSFLAVVAIVCFYRPVRALLARLKSPLEDLQAPEERSLALRAWIVGKRASFPPLGVSVAATIGVLPLIAYTFNIVSPIGIICNAIFVPFAALVVWLGLGGLALACVLSAFWSGAPILIKPACAAALLLERAAGAAAHLPGSHFYTGGPPLWFLIAYYGLLLAVIHRRRLRLSARRCAIAFLILLNVLAASALWPSRDGLTITCFDVRHGGCTFVELPSGKTLLYDCGTAGAFFDVGAYLVAPALWSRGIHTIDLLVLSHPDTDHINGVISLADRIRIGTVLHPPGFENEPLGARLLEELDARGIPRRQAVASQVLELGDATIEMLNPPQAGGLRPGADPNNRSLVVRLNCAGGRFLFCGDIQTPAIAWLLNSGQDLRSDLIFAPHHGSYYSNIPELLRAAEPTTAIISCDRGFVSAQLYDALEANGIRAFETAKCGAIQVKHVAGKIRVEPFVKSR